MYKIVDFVTKELVQPHSHVYCDGDNQWEVVMDLEEVHSKINFDFYRKSEAVISKYFPFLPIKDFASFVTMNEGSTPLLRSKVIGKQLGVDLYFKQEFQNPTGSFKDRGSAVELTVAKELGVKGVCVASTGNMAASCSCYAAAAQIPCFVFVPEDTPASKLSQTISYGGRIVQVRGSYNDAASLAERVARELGFYLAGDYAFRVEGQKTAAFEVLDQLFFQIPDAVVVPMGCGTNISGYAKGFQEYLRLGFIDRVPQLIGTQAEGAKSIVNAFNEGSNQVAKLDKLDTIASAIAVLRPIDGVKALDGIYRSKGSAVAVSDREILEAQYLLSREEGLYVEASSATTVASLYKMKREGTLPSGRVVCVLTGDGLKDPSPMLRMAIKPPTITPSVDNFLSLYERSFFEGRTVAFVDRGSALFSAPPQESEIADAALSHLGSKLPPAVLNRVRIGIERFLKKGKIISLADFQDIIQEVLEGGEGGQQVMKVIDFEVVTGKDRPPRGEVVVSLDGEEFSASSEGVGPVDAVINALRKACGNRLGFSLENFEVVIRSSGTDAVVFTDMKLKANGRTAIGRGTSPDVIQAGIEAFERAYNSLELAAKGS